MPDLSLLIPLSEILDVSINDLLSGEIVNKEIYQKSFEKNVITTITSFRQKSNKIINIVIYMIILLFLGILATKLFADNYEVTLSYDKNKMYVQCDNEIDLGNGITQKLDKCQLNFYALNMNDLHIDYLVKEDIIFVSLKQGLTDFNNNHHQMMICREENKCIKTWDTIKFDTTKLIKFIIQAKN